MTRPFSELEPAEAEAVVARFVDGRPQALARLRDRLAADGQDVRTVLDGSVESLVPLWAWIKAALRRRDDDGWESEAEPFEGQSVPEWYRHETREERLLSLDAVHLLDGVVAYVGDVVIGAVPGVAWKRGHDRVRSYVDQNRPVLVRGDVAVAVSRMVLGSARSHLFEPGSSPDDQPRTRVDRWIDELRRADVPEEAAEEPLAAVLEEQVAVERGEEADEWVVEFGDDVRAAVGQPALDRLVHALPGNAGVIAATFEDREVLVASGTVDPVVLKRWVVAELTRAAAAER
jgi:hypothetical protein